MQKFIKYSNELDYQKDTSSISDDEYKTLSDMLEASTLELMEEMIWNACLSFTTNQKQILQGYLKHWLITQHKQGKIIIKGE